MDFNNHLLKFLICPRCKNEFKITKQNKNNNENAAELVCKKCFARYPIIDEIPRILPWKIDKIKRKTGNNFGYEWKVFPQQFHFYQDEFLGWIKPITAQDLRGKVVLDAGCGNGRHAYLSAQFGAKEIVGFDLSESVEVAYAKTKKNKNICILQSDMYNLPLKPMFDYIYCIGVLHHLPDPEKGFNRLVRLLKPCGKISIWVYGKEGNFVVRKFIDPIRLHITSRMPMPITFLLSFPLAVLFYVIAKLLYKPLFECKSLKFITKYLPLSDYIYYMSKFNFIYNFSNVFDQLLAVVTHYISKEEVGSWFKKAGLSDVVITCRNNNSWRAMGTKAE